MFENLEKNILEFNYDIYYKKMCEYIKEISDVNEFKKEKKRLRKELENSLNINKELIDIKYLKNNFANILLEENSSEILWILNSTYVDETYEVSYLDTVSDIIKKSNEVVRKGVNTYKANGWMTHTLYVYQLANKNIAKNIIPNNFKEDIQKIEFIKECFNELHKNYLELDHTLKFIFKLTTFIHDIGVVESVKDHGYHGQKFVNQILQDIGITDEFLQKNNIDISLENLRILEKALLNDHTIYTGVSSEYSDNLVDEQYRKFLKKIENIKIDKKKITSILHMFTVCDVIGVNESIFSEQKFNLLKQAKEFFYEIIDNKNHVRDKKKVATQRLCDFVGIFDEQLIKSKTENALKKMNIESDLFWERMYNAGQFWFFLSIMKEISQNFDNVIKTLNAIFDVVSNKCGEKEIETFTVTWVPNNNEKQAVENINNGTFFEAINIFKNTNENSIEFEKNKLSINKRNERYYFEIEIL